MRSAILASILLTLALAAFGQHRKPEPLGGKTNSKTKRPPKPKATPAKTSDKSYTDPCDVYYKDFGEMVDELNLPDKWLPLAETSTTEFLYNPRKITCFSDIKTIRAWIKEEHRNADSKYALVLYEVKCSDRKLRVTSATEYDKDRNVLETSTFEDTAWEYPIPDSANEGVMNQICHL